MSNESNHASSEYQVWLLLTAFCGSLVVTGLLIESPAETAAQWWRILTSTGTLITDFTAVGGLAGALVNAGVLGLVSLALARLIGLTHLAYLTVSTLMITGFGFCGKDLFNIWPNFVGVTLYGFHQRKPLRDLAPSLFLGTTLAPMVSQISLGFDWGWPGFFGGMLIGIGNGFLLAALTTHVFSMHLGYSLYNIGTTGGLVGTVVYMFLRGLGYVVSPQLTWGTEHTLFLTLFFGVWFMLLLLIGLVQEHSLRGWIAIMQRPGRLPENFYEVGGIGAVFLNMGTLGLIGITYALFVGGTINGSIVAAVLAMAGFGAMGKHPRNVLPVMLGAFLVCLPKTWAPSDPPAVLAVLFSTALAPLCGRFGIVAGLIAGALHVPMAMHVGSLHGSMNLYNSGFASGLATVVFIGFIKGTYPEWLESPAPGAARSDPASVSSSTGQTTR